MAAMSGRSKGAAACCVLTLRSAFRGGNAVCSFLFVSSDIFTWAFIVFAGNIGEIGSASAGGQAHCFPGLKDPLSRTSSAPLWAGQEALAPWLVDCFRFFSRGSWLLVLSVKSVFCSLNIERFPAFFG